MTSEGSGPMRSKEYLQNGTLYWDTLNYSDWVAFPDGLPDTTDWLNLDEVLYHPSELILITRIMPIILAIGLAGNMAFLFVVFRVRWMRTVVNFYLINLAVADIVFLCVAIGEKLGMHISRPDVYDEGSKGISGCMLISFTKGWCYFTSITLVTLVSKDLRTGSSCKLGSLRYRRLQALPFLVALSGNVIIYVCIFRAINDRVSKTMPP
ncbi:somatostatin receptor type 5-like [Strongylocentrotus purpuratus]|uniref:G-protein coupled receptors family 1 profile domain-containing protein n=1 Tax=Strongylocentrotus purpuratus TaxID=7668 RepID=A0A7M7PQU4_STRPU|nr:somatostatin receptor type 5-like [Strongylocentrotus purpuratus]